MSDLLSISDLSITFDNGPRVVDGLSFSIDKGQTLALVGESGSGKSVSALSILRLLDERHAAYPAGHILYKGEDLLQAKEKQNQKNQPQPEQTILRQEQNWKQKEKNME